MDEIIVLSSWGDRFWAWLIDVLLICLIWYKIIIVLDVGVFTISGILLLSSLLFIYWTSLEGYRGQSVGKMFLKIAVTGPYGEQIRFRDAAEESFGKAFLLPVDVLMSLILFQKSRQRLFNKISNTIVINRTEIE
ncbi:MAG: RDD family protein [Methanothrix sp.]|jgi:uncharacterized RDD family membrane protein YckC